MKTTIISLALLISLPTGGWLLWRSSTDASPHTQTRKVLYYQDSMHPWVKSDKPGKCTVCDMDLTPIYEGQQGFGGGENVVALSSNSITVLNVQTEEVKRQSLRRVLRVAGLLDANEAKKTIISAPTAGRIEETAVDYVGVEVHKGQRLLTFYSPELTQQKYRYLVRAQRAPEQRDPTGGLAWQKGDADPYYTDLVAPFSGTVIERNVARGQYVSEGERLFTIADATVLWFRFDVYEQQLPWLRLGQKVEVSLPAIPGDVFEAVISFIDPLLDLTTRTVKVRADINNPVVELDGAKQRLFKFGMYAEGEVRAEVANRLAVPRAAVLHPGNSAYAYIDKGGGAYERRLLKLGQQGDDLCEVRAGLEEGDRVVTSGNVLVDAQAQFSQTGQAEEEVRDARDLTPAELPATHHAVDEAVASQSGAAPREEPTTAVKPRMAVAQASPAARGDEPFTASGARRRRAPGTGIPDPIPTGGRRNLEGAMFVRMAEMRNEELAEARAAKADGAGNSTVQVSPPPATSSLAPEKKAWGQEIREIRLAALKARAKGAAATNTGAANQGLAMPVAVPPEVPPQQPAGAPPLAAPSESAGPAASLPAASPAQVAETGP
jgi:membrane fusion protein, copper/silver efflux system